ncbi:hypothetical protein GPA10_05050 [Streptomyces sp. p1417]|uniref:Uncharacterized protein n=1 Tax=Streptomyces typhae TaxID=2681492 RepID=A0A6L6WPZ7_9ACTN|nr:hypothetical protein [Streptomyces typhae]MVO84153.1 hypothetical protein [Streptomyces typhae]
MTIPRDDLTGRTFGSWAVLEFSHRAANRAALWSCRCACGAEKAVRGTDLTRGRSTRCPDCVKVATGAHGRKLYKVWHNIRQRCENPEHRDWSRYGGRGIRVCERWQQFVNFHADMAPAYRAGLTVERTDNDGPYSPDNCRWATRTEQSRNRRNSQFATLYGRTAPVAEWAELLGLEAGVIRDRLNKLGWPVERALTTGANPNVLACLAKSTDAGHRCPVCA